MTWSGRWYKLGPTIHAEQFGSATTVCGRKIRRDARAVDLDISDEICDDCWKGATS